MAQDDQESDPPKVRGLRVTIHTNLPDKLPVLSGEVALIRAFLGDLVARIAVNDNEDEP